jgi:hypothetical protein
MTAEPLRARVFISCGQSKETDEAQVARDIGARLRDLGYCAYIAVDVQDLHGLRENIFDQLRKSEYFLFIDFKRERLRDCDYHRGSLFSHQELAIASLFEIDVVAFREKDVKPQDGLARYLHLNETEFSDKSMLPDEVIGVVQRRGWRPNWRNELVLEASPRPVDYKGAECFHVRVKNHHRDKLALNCSAYLEKVIKLPNTEREMPDEMLECKWAATPLPRVSIPAGKSRRFDVCYAQANEVVFPPITDTPEYIFRIPREEESYELSYLVTSDNFPPVRGRFILDLRNALAETSLRLAPE